MAHYEPEWPTDEVGHIEIITETGQRRYYCLSHKFALGQRCYAVIVPRDSVDSLPIVCSYHLKSVPGSSEIRAVVTPLGNSWERLKALKLLSLSHHDEVH